MKKILNGFIAFFILLLVFIEFLHPTNELAVDLGEHLLAGNLTVETHKILTTNLFSYTNTNYPYIHHEWLTEVVFYFINTNFGLNGLILLTVFIMLISFGILYFSQFKTQNKLLVSYGAVFYLLILFERADILPEIMSYLFLSLYIFLLYHFRKNNTKIIYFLIPLQLLWVNMHIYFILGIFLIALFLIEGVISLRSKYQGRYTKTLLIVFFASIIVSLCNPNGLAGFLYPFFFFQNYAFPVAENLNIYTYMSLHSGAMYVSIIIFQILAIILILLLFINIKRSRLIDWFLSISFIAISASALRNLPLFVFSTFIPFIFTLQTIIKTHAGSLKKLLPFRVPQLPLLMSILLIAITGYLIISMPQVNGFGLGETKTYKNAIDFFVSNNIKGPIYNDYDIGSYLAYRIYPKEKVFVDTRPEAYPASFFQNIYFPMQKYENIFQKVDNSYHFNAIIYSLQNGIPESPGFIRYIIDNKDWSMVYLDGTAVIFIKNDKVNKNIISRYVITEANYQVPNFNSWETLDNLTYFFNQVGWKSPSIKVYQKMLTIDPHNCSVLNNLLFLMGQNNPVSSSYVTNFEFYCNSSTK